MIVVADTSPLNYLVLPDCVDLLPRLYGAIAVPQMVWDELQHPDSPGKVRAWCQSAPSWLAVHHLPSNRASATPTIHLGEAQAIALAVDLRAAAFIVDDWFGRQEAQRRNIAVFGTLRVLQDAADQGWIHLAAVLTILRNTNFRVKESLLKDMLARDAARRPDQGTR